MSTADPPPATESSPMEETGGTQETLSTEVVDMATTTTTAGASTVSAQEPLEVSQRTQPEKAEVPLSPLSILTKGSKRISVGSTASTGSNRRVSKRIKIKRKSRPTPKFCHDAITVVIPLGVTADLKIAVQRTRNKRIQSIYKRFPSLKKAVRKNQQEKQQQQKLLLKDQEDDEDEENASKGDDAMDVDGPKDAQKDPSKAEDEGKENNGKQKKKKKLANVPQPEHFGSVLDYLEAKYVRGVMLGDDNADGVSLEDGSEGHGSVYSGGSFLDDTDLQRDVAEQVMANTTLTKLELEEDEGEFFVNVGNLEVEENNYGENYDPAQDKDTATTTKKRKKPASTADKGATKKKKKTSTTATAGSGNGNKTKKAAKSDALGESAKSKKSTTSATSQKSKAEKKSASSTSKKKKTPDPDEPELTEERKGQLEAAKEAKAKSDAIFDKIVSSIKNMSEEDLPRRKTKLKVALTCPPNKNPGDDITFANPHNPGQRLRVKVPKSTLPGGTFKVSVPVKPKPEDEASDGKDHNSFSRDVQVALDEYARAYDEYCRKQADVDKKFALGKEKQAKFDPIVAAFPKNLVTPVDVEYLKKLIRRARQSSYKRKKTMAMKQETTAGQSGDGKPDAKTTAPKAKAKPKAKETSKVTKKEPTETPTPAPATSSTETKN